MCTVNCCGMCRMLSEHHRTVSYPSTQVFSSSASLTSHKQHCREHVRCRSVGSIWFQQMSLVADAGQQTLLATYDSSTTSSERHCIVDGRQVWRSRDRWRHCTWCNGSASRQSGTRHQTTAELVTWHTLPVAVWDRCCRQRECTTVATTFDLQLTQTWQ